jgi:prepilin-type processing-associated H-X9-DG protein
MHRAGNNILFADGHVLAFKKYDPQALTYHPFKFQNWGDVGGSNNPPPPPPPRRRDECTRCDEVAGIMPG